MKKNESLCKFKFNKNMFVNSLKSNLNHKKRRKTNKDIVAFLNTNNNCYPTPSDRYPRPCPRSRRAYEKAQKNEISTQPQLSSPVVSLHEIPYLEDENIYQKPKTFPRLRHSRTSNVDWEPNISDFDQVEKELDLENQESKVMEKVYNCKNSPKKIEQLNELQKTNSKCKTAETAKDSCEIDPEFMDKFKRFLNAVDKRIFNEKNSNKEKEPHHWSQDKNYQELLFKQRMRLKNKMNARLSPFDNLREIHHLTDMQHFLNSVEAQLYTKSQLSDKEKLKNIKTVKKKLESVYQHFILKPPFDSLFPIAPQNTEPKIKSKRKKHKLSAFESELFSEVNEDISHKNFADFDSSPTKPTTSEPTLSHQEASTNTTLKSTSNIFQGEKLKKILKRSSSSMASLMLNSRGNSSTSFFGKESKVPVHFTASNHNVLKKLIKLTTVKSDKRCNSHSNKAKSKFEDEQQNLKELSQQQKQLQQHLNNLKNKSRPTSCKIQSKPQNTNTLSKDYITMCLNDHAASRRKRSRLYLRQQQELQRKLQQLETQQNLKFQELLKQQREQLIELQALKNSRKKHSKIKSRKMSKDPPPTAPVTLYSIICQRSMSVPPAAPTSEAGSQSVLTESPLCIKDVEIKEATKTISEPVVEKKCQDVAVMAKLQMSARKKHIHKDSNLMRENRRNHNGQNLRLIKKQLKQRQKIQALPRKRNPSSHNKPTIKVESIISLPSQTFKDPYDSSTPFKSSCESIKATHKQSSNSFVSVKSFSSAKVPQVKWSREEKMDDDEVSRIFFQDDPPIHFHQGNFGTTDTDLLKEKGVMWEETNRRKTKLISHIQSQIDCEKEATPPIKPSTRRGIPKCIGRSVPVVTSHSGSTIGGGNNSIDFDKNEDKASKKVDATQDNQFTQVMDKRKSDGVMKKFLEISNDEKHAGVIRMVENTYQEKKEEMVVKEWMAMDPPPNESRSFIKIDEITIPPPVMKDDAMTKSSISSRNNFSQTSEDPMEARKKMEEDILRSISSYSCLNAPVQNHTLVITPSGCLGVKECVINNMCEKMNSGLEGDGVLDRTVERESRSRVQVRPSLDSSVNTDFKMGTMPVNRSCLVSRSRTMSRSESRDGSSKLMGNNGSRTDSGRALTEFERLVESRMGKDEIAVKEGKIGRGGRLNSLEPLNVGKGMVPLTENNFKPTSFKSENKLRGILRDTGFTPLSKSITYTCKENVDEQCKRFSKHFDSVNIESSTQTLPEE